MKTRTTLAMLMVVSLLCVLTACGSSKLSGRYELVDVIDDPEGLTLANLEEMYTDSGLKAADYFYMEFLDGDRFKLVMFGKEEAKGTFTMNDSVLMLTSEGGTTTVDISEKKIAWTYFSGGKLVFEKK